MPEISAPLAAAVAATSLLAAVVGGVTGMSTGIIAIPVLAFAFGVRLAVPIITVAMLFNTLSRCVANRDYVDWRAARWYSLGAVPAAAFGAAVFAYIPADLLARGLGAFLLIRVAHEGNQSASVEEAERVADLHRQLLSGASWTDRLGVSRPITHDDVLIVAPYNAHLAEIGKLLPHGARFGTVDKFQGQEAPIVIYSMATSSPEDAPRGMEFLYSLNRLNVATSRARCVSVLAASPLLFEPECKTPRQMRLANALCRYLEIARKWEEQ